MQGIIDDPAGFCADGSVVTYECLMTDGDAGGEEDSGPVLVYGFIAAGLHSDLGGITVASMEGSAPSFTPWRLAARPRTEPSVDKPWLIKGNSSGSELYLVYKRGTRNLGYARSRDFGASWYPGPDSDLDLIQVGQEIVRSGLGPYAAAVENGNLYVAYNREDDRIGLLEGVDQADGSVVFNHLFEDQKTVLALSRNRSSNDYGNAIPCMQTFGHGPVWSWPQIAVLPGTPTTLIIVYHDTPSADSRDLNCYSVRVRKQGEYWAIIDTPPVLVHPDNDPDDDDQFLPTVTVDAAGRILVVSYDDRNYRTQRDYRDPECGEPWNSDLDVYLAFSVNGGQSFNQEDLELCRNPQEMCDRTGIPSPMAIDFSARLNHYYYIGEYIGIASRGDRFIAVFNGSDRTVNPNRDKTVIWATEGSF